MKTLRTNLLLIVLMLVAFDSYAVGSWTGGQDTYHVPMAWCVVNGSPAEAAPNIPPDTGTDAIIWRRHERPTDNIYINPTGISFRSAIFNTWGNLNFPKIDGPIDGGSGLPVPDILMDSISEFNTLIDNCRTGWGFDPGAGFPNLGVTAINIRLFHNSDEDFYENGNSSTHNIPIAFGGCTIASSGLCSTPYDPYIIVTDNAYHFPDSPNRTLPNGSTFPVQDRVDRVVGSALSWALGVAQVSDTANLAHPFPIDSGGDGEADNIALLASQITTLRSNAQSVPGLEIDPPGVFNPGRFVTLRLMDPRDETEDRPAYLDIASVRAGLDKKDSIFSIDIQLSGLIPEKAEALQFWTALVTRDTDDVIQPSLFASISAPSFKIPSGDFILINTVVEDGKAQAKIWQFRDGKPIDFRGKFTATINRLIMHPQFATEVTDPKYPPTKPLPVFDSISIKLPALDADVRFAAPFHITTTVQQGEEQVADQFGDNGNNKFVLTDPSFAHCYVETEAKPGETVKVRIERLRPNANIHGLLGPLMVFTGKTDFTGGGIIDFPIPADSNEGYHLVTIGVDDTALTADCTVKVDKNAGTLEPCEECFADNQRYLIIIGILLLATLLLTFLLILCKRK